MLYLFEPMEESFHNRVVKYAKIAMFVAFGVNLVRIAWRTWKYGGSKEVREDTFDFGEDPLDEVEGVD